MMPLGGLCKGLDFVVIIVVPTPALFQDAVDRIRLKLHHLNTQEHWWQINQSSYTMHPRDAKPQKNQLALNKLKSIS